MIDLFKPGIPLTDAQTRGLSGIYRITTPSKNFYFGMAKDINTRWNTHRRNSHNDAIRNSILKYGIDNHTFEVVEIVTDLKVLSEREQQWLNAAFIAKKARRIKLLNVQHISPGMAAQSIGAPTVKVIEDARFAVDLAKQFVSLDNEKAYWHFFNADYLVMKVNCMLLAIDEAKNSLLFSVGTSDENFQLVNDLWELHKNHPSKEFHKSMRKNARQIIDIRRQREMSKTSRKYS